MNTTAQVLFTQTSSKYRGSTANDYASAQACNSKGSADSYGTCVPDLQSSSSNPLSILYAACTERKVYTLHTTLFSCVTWQAF
jgi:hypothetical protein